MGARQPYRRFLATVRRGEDDQKFWRYQDVPAIAGPLVRRPPGRPRPPRRRTPVGRAARRALVAHGPRSWGLDVTGLDTERTPAQRLARGSWRPSCCAASTGGIPRPRRSPALTRHVKGSFVPDGLAGSAVRESFVLPARTRLGPRALGRAPSPRLGARAYDVVGDLGGPAAGRPAGGAYARRRERHRAAGRGHDRGRHAWASRPVPATLDEALDLVTADLLRRSGPQRGTSAQ